MLEVINVSKKYGDISAVNALSFKVKPGRIFGLLGPNGAGKTTTMRMISNIIKPSEGKILFNNKSLSDFYDITGYLPEERGLYKKSNVIDLILYFAVLKGMKKTSAKTAALNWLEKLGIGNYKNRKVEELSKGNQQKIQFLISVIHDPEILILDEPFTGFDPINQQEIKNIILDLIGSGKVIILSTHQMDVAEKLCDEILLINKGKEICSGDITELKKKFGGNNIHLKFNGISDFIKNDASILSYEIYNNSAEIKLKDSVNPADFLKSIINKTSVTEFLTVEPSLNKIFLEVVKKSERVI